MKSAEVLTDALSYIKSFKGQIFVVKMGSEVISRREVLESISEDLTLLKFLGIHPVVVHGGGVEISEEMKRLGKKPTFIKGLRVTDKETIDVVKKVFRKINGRIVSSIRACGGRAISFPTREETLFQSEKKKSDVDIGYVGEIKRINAKTLLAKIEKGFIPVVSSIGQSNEGYPLNINADTAAAELASSLKASKIIFLTDVRGVLDAGKNLIKTLTLKETNRLIEDNTASGGMIPKLRACIRALDKNVKSAHIIKAGGHALLEEILTTEGTGTMIAQ